jgi:homogentisate 1,2-dioxygenase
MDESGPAGVPSDFPHQNRPLFDEFRMKRRLESTPDDDDEAWLSLEYLSGFHNHCATEAVTGVLPIGQNSPQHVKHCLYAEQLSGSAFTCPRATNRKSWCYRLAPSVMQGAYIPHAPPVGCGESLLSADFSVVDPSPRRWSPFPLASDESIVDFVDGLHTMCGAGSPSLKDGVAIHMYAFNAPMVDRAFCNADGELLVVPQQGVLHVLTELGKLRVAPGEILVVPRNLRFSVSPASPGSDPVRKMDCRGYVCEVYASRGFVLPELGPIGANGLAEPRDFLTPVACFEDRRCPNGFVITTKYVMNASDCLLTGS